MKQTIGNKTIIAGAKVTASRAVSTYEHCLDLSYLEYDKNAKKEVKRSVSVTFADDKYNEWTARFKKLDEKGLVGSYIMVKFNLTEDGKAIGTDFFLPGRKSGLKYEKNGEEKFIVILFGRAKVREDAKFTTANGNTGFSVTVPIDTFKDGKENTEWIKVTFWNGTDNNGNENALADRAEKAIKDGDLIAINAGSVKTVTNDEGKTYFNATGFNFDIVSRKKKDETSDSEETEEETTLASTYDENFDDDDDDEEPIF